MDTQKKAYAVNNKLGRTRFYMGGYWTFLATGAETNGQFSLIEVNLRKGLEPPRHTHTREDESFHLLDGEMLFVVGDNEHHLKAGDFLHIPRGITHSFKLKTDKVKVLIHLAPAGLEEMFIEMSRPADVLDYPPAPVGPPPAEWIQRMQQLQEKYGIVGMDNKHIKAE